MARGGADIIEIGIPFPIPLRGKRDPAGEYQGAVCRRHSEKVFDLVASVRMKSDIPLYF
jgi:tryptophan synthase alpha subunit